MSEEQLKAFIVKVKGDTSLQEKLKAAADANAVAAIANEAGFSISTEDLEKPQNEISEKELEGAAAGTFFTIFGNDLPGVDQGWNIFGGDHTCFA